MQHQYTTDSIAGTPQRLLKQIQGAGEDQSIGTDPPERLEQAMGRVGESRMLSLSTRDHDTGADATITLWLWLEAVGKEDGSSDTNKWQYGGANDNDSTKIFKEKGWGGWRVPKGALYFLQSTVEIGRAWVEDTNIPVNSEQNP